ncbi:MAG TPA: response regulator [Thermodesulfobacteriota bacterium]|nr:response regulator [Deltaproteobacteria bacterium]HNR12906.1 response regulator [Thermodesulfobacteriota bacterium]HNU72949.1 response regulator [Thermodesulfobacteriota bacterium]HQP57319.1 response regulator [Syntrophorhabdus sp.]
MNTVTLLIEADAPFRRALIEALLSCDPTIHIKQAYDRIQAQKIIHEHQPQWIIMDLDVLGAEGFELTYKAVHLNPKSHVVMLSPCIALELLIAAAHVGAMSFMLKGPQSIEEIVGLMKDVNSWRPGPLREDNLPSGRLF